MLVVFGANGLTGIEVIKEAKLRGIPVRPIARNDHDTHRLQEILPVNEICYADANHPDSIESVLSDATAVVSCIDSRTAGFASPIYDPMAAANIVQVAHKLQISKMLHLSVMGGYRWSPNPLNKRSYHLDIRLRRLQVPWTMLRVSCYHDEIIHGHIRPPDGGTPHAFRASSRYSPVSRRDTARVICNLLPDLIPNRTWLLGGPKVYRGIELQSLIKQYATKGNLSTHYGALPHGDFSVAPQTTEIMVGWIPTETVEWMLDPQNHPIHQQTPTSPFWNRPEPTPHRMDQGETSILSALSAGTRFAVYQGLEMDMPNLLQTMAIPNIPTEEISLDCTRAKFATDLFSDRVHQNILSPIANIDIIHNGRSIHSGHMQYIYDELADSLHIWWTDNLQQPVIPAHIWKEVDLGVRRRLGNHTFWKNSTSVREFFADRHERVPIS